MYLHQTYLRKTSPWDYLTSREEDLERVIKIVGDKSYESPLAQKVGYKRYKSGYLIRKIFAVRCVATITFLWS